MPHEQNNREEEKLKFTPEGEAVAYISLEQARLLALQTARDSTGYYGRRYASRPPVLEVISSEEGEDFYYVRISYRPAGRFQGEPGTEQFTVDKTGTVELRQILSEPQAKSRMALVLSGVGVLVMAGGIIGGLAGSGVFSSSSSPFDQRESQVTTGAVSVAVAPDAPAQLSSPDGDVHIDLPAGSVDRSLLLS